MNDVPAREFIIETGNINFVRRIMAVRNFAIGNPSGKAATAATFHKHVGIQPV